MYVGIPVKYPEFLSYVKVNKASVVLNCMWIELLSDIAGDTDNPR
jgi:hypothetical protein